MRGAVFLFAAENRHRLRHAWRLVLVAFNCLVCLSVSWLSLIIGCICIFDFYLLFACIFQFELFGVQVHFSLLGFSLHLGLHLLCLFCS